MSGRISALKNKINKLRSENDYLDIKSMILGILIDENKENIDKLRHELQAKDDVITDKDKEILKLKQDIQCKQLEVDSLEIKLDAQKKEFENNKFKNRFKKMFCS